MVNAVGKLKTESTDYWIRHSAQSACEVRNRQSNTPSLAPKPCRSNKDGQDRNNRLGVRTTKGKATTNGKATTKVGRISTNERAS